MECICVPFYGIWPGPADVFVIEATDPEDLSNHVIQRYQVWRTRVYRQETPVFLELSWDPDHGQRLSLEGLENGPDERTRNSVYASRRLLFTALAAGGRPSGSGKKHPTRELYVDAIHALYTKVDAQGWKHKLLENDDEWLAQELDCSTTILYERNREYGITLDDIRHRKV